MADSTRKIYLDFYIRPVLAWVPKYTPSENISLSDAYAETVNDSSADSILVNETQNLIWGEFDIVFFDNGGDNGMVGGVMRTVYITDERYLR
jgi:hypothetical protein